MRKTASLIALMAACLTTAALAQDNSDDWRHSRIRHVMLLLSNPDFKARTVYSEVGTLQVGPTILKALGLDPRELDGVRLDGTGVLPDVKLDSNQ